MSKQIIEYASPVDTLIALVKKLYAYETEHHMDSAEFFEKYNRGELGDNEVFAEWSGNYKHFSAIRKELKTKLQYAA
ncbi:hypothetical protein S7335_4362 [Synechococcus sp. PCC 7335]|uniref:antitoxin TumA n=1 Tax=Synechococcus sp. (strain ATCC 29403 / PCC 7335) TaxID=91464 RepID=UPI00017EE3D7|nr:hypothetical protein [Synechococcus sp. PCC 7335]EDX86657.1 hypothetical protein S7335_4362 [Synechococcus sp. PCC 7335]